ncbi:hypothetical protein [Bartonella pachyuromydis]
MWVKLDKKGVKIPLMNALKGKSSGNIEGWQSKFWCRLAPPQA